MELVRPSKIRLEVSSHCQLRCPSCPTTTKAIHPVVGSGLLSLDAFTRLLDDNPWLKVIELSNYGEVFLNPDLLPMLRYAHERGVELRVENGANLNYASPDVLEGLVKYGVRAILCSIDGATQQTYAQYRVRGKLDTVLSNIATINRHKRDYQSAVPKLTWQFVAFGHNEHEIPAARAMAADLGMSFEVKLSWDPDFSPVEDKESLRDVAGAASRREFKEERGVDYMESICHQLWDAPQINWDGKVLGCCRNFWGDFGPENAFRDGLLPGINSEKMSYARQMLQGQQPARADIPCTTCHLYVDMKSDGRWLKRRVPSRRERVMSALRSWLGRQHAG
ncbi:MAG: radical SAM protein [Acidobacteria bacterium]|nr:radical SAM protein [Acidobacteriota bacterium]